MPAHQHVSALAPPRPQGITHYTGISARFQERVLTFIAKWRFVDALSQPTRWQRAAPAESESNGHPTHFLFIGAARCEAFFAELLAGVLSPSADGVPLRLVHAAPGHTHQVRAGLSLCSRRALARCTTTGLR